MDHNNTVPVVTGTPLPPPVMAQSTAQQQQKQQPTYNAQGIPIVTATAAPQDAHTTTTTITSHVLQTLQQQGFTAGLAEALQANQRAFPLAIWIVDNSGSMANRDGHRLVETNSSTAVRFVACTRWAELQQSVEYHVQLAALLNAPTHFRLLNDPGRVAGPQLFEIATSGAYLLQQQVSVAQSVMRESTPNGVTPLVPHLHAVRQQVLQLEQQLRRDGCKVAIVLATDGLPSDERGISNSQTQQEFVQALRALEGLPVWMVVRLCTDEDQVVEFWNNLDSQLELSLEVLDDFVSEAKEVHQAGNGWLNYGLPLHRMREMGFYSKLFDMLDERPLGNDELRDMVRLLFGTAHMDGLPDPEVDWDGFVEAVDRINRSQAQTWNPITKRMECWIDIRKLKSAYGKDGGFGTFFRLSVRNRFMEQAV